MTKSLFRFILPALAAAAGLGFLACEDSDPVAIEGSIITLSANPNPVTPGATALVTARVTSSTGVPQEDVSVVFSLTSGTGTLTPEITTTDANGQAVTSYSSTGQTTATIEVRSGGITKTLNITVAAGTPTVHIFTTSDPSIDSCAENILLTGQVLGAGNAPIVGARVDFAEITGTTSGADGDFDPISAVTDSSGRYSVVYRLKNASCTTCQSTSCSLVLEATALSLESNPVTLTESL